MADEMPMHLQGHIHKWLSVNEKTPSQVRYGSFPLGMVQGWIERAQAAEERVKEIEGEIDRLADFASDSLESPIGQTDIVARLNALCVGRPK